MQIKTLLQDEDAVSPVIGVILMVAITVILAAVIGTFVLGLGDQVQSSAPNTNFQFEYSSGPSVTITHNGGQDVEGDNLDVVGSNGNSASVSSGTYTTGDKILDGSNAFAANEVIRVVWSSPAGGSSNTIGESTVPS